ncbi:hypothetical protein [Actinotalea sp.]|uniref:hypothetical protein n=1 Tax=Actinotalea sp. TaxID=1872145 RepID=UPI00356A49FF
MDITPSTLLRGAAVAAVAAGGLFIGVQIGHPHFDVDFLTSTEGFVRNSSKAVMAVLALVGITGLYLRQVRQAGVLGLIGYLVLGLGYLLMTSSVLMVANVLPTVAGISTGYVPDVAAAMTGGSPEGDIGTLRTLLRVQDLAYLGGGLLFGVALFRARVLMRWATILLAFSGVLTIVVSSLPDPFYRLVAVPNGLALIALGFSLWRSLSIVAPEPDLEGPGARAYATSDL